MKLDCTNTYVWNVIFDVRLVDQTWMIEITIVNTKLVNTTNNNEILEKEEEQGRTSLEIFAELTKFHRRVVRLPGPDVE